MKRNVLTVFLASPGDLQDERKGVREAVERINKVVGRRLDWHIELLVWEDTLPGYARPQALINKDVKSCDLFIGMLWQRWGEPTGKYTSGFEEEFALASERRKTSSQPEIWLFFKAVDANAINDAGPQLRKLLQFKENQIQLKEVLFKEFKESKEWEKMVYDDLLRYVLDLAGKPAQEEAVAQQSVEPRRLTGEARASPTAQPYPEQLAQLFAKVKDVPEKGISILDFLDRSRLHLLTSAWFSESHSGEILEVHETNIAYRYRKDWNLSAEERWLLVRSAIGDRTSFRPGWYWLRDWDDERVSGVLCSLATKTVNDDVRLGAFSLLTDIRYQAPREVLEKGLIDKDNRVVLQTIRLFRASGQTKNLELLAPLLKSDNSEVRDAAVAARVEILYLENPNKGFAELLKLGAKVPTLLSAAAERMDLKVDKELLLSALQNSERSVQSFAARYLREKQMLSEDICKELLKNPNVYVKKEGLLGLIDLGKQVTLQQVEEVLPAGPLFSEREEVFFAVLSRLNVQQLTVLIDWYGRTGDSAYRLMATNHFESVEHRIRSDLEDEFRSLRSESEGRFEAPLKEDLQDFIKAKYISAALAGLVKNGKPADVKYARKFLGTTPYHMADREAINLLARFGDSSDTGRLLQFASRASGEYTRLAAKTALKLSPALDGVLPTMLHHDNTTIGGIAAESLLSVPPPESVKMAKALLVSENDSIRLKGLAVLTHHCNKKDLETILDEYLQRRSYYYNVVTWLDRYIFAPGQYGEFFQNQLMAMVQQDEPK